MTLQHDPRTLGYRTSAFTRKDGQFLDMLVQAYKEYPVLSQAALVGSLGAKFYVDPMFKGSLNGITDVDFFFSRIPDELRSRLILARFIDHVQRRVRLDGLQVTVEEIPVYGDSFHRLEMSMGELDIFEETIGNLYVPDLPAETFYFRDENVHATVAHPSILIAAGINPESQTKRRMHRAHLLFKSLQYRADELREGCRAVFEHSTLKQREVAKVGRIAQGRYERKDPTFYAFVQHVLPM